MALVFMDGFDLYASASEMQRRGWVLGSASPNTMQTGRFGGRAFSLSNGNNILMFQPITATDAFAIGFAFKTDNVGSFGAGGGEILQFRNGATTILKLAIINNGRIALGRTDVTSTLICQSAINTIASNTWYYVELEITRHASAGVATIYVNGVNVATASGANTGASIIDSFGMNGGFTNVYYDDLYVTNTAAKLGECRIETLRPTVDTATKDFTRSAGANNFDNVDDVQTDDDTTYNFSGTVGHKDLFDLANLSSTPLTVLAVQPILCAKKDNSATRQIRHNMKNGVTTTNGTTRNLSGSYLYYADIYVLNPDTAAAFDGTAVNAMQLGYEVVA